METIFVVYTILCSLSFLTIGIIRIIKATNRVQVSDGLFEIFLGIVFPGGLIMSFFFIMIAMFELCDLIIKWHVKLAKEKDISDIQKFYIKKFGVVPPQEKTIPLHTEKQMLDFANEWHSANTPVSGRSEQLNFKIISYDKTRLLETN